MVDINRRRFLQAGAAVGLGAMAGPFEGFLAGPAPVGANGPSSYGPLAPVPDQRDGKIRLDLPAGFNYRSFDVARQPWFGLASLPGRPDGMAAFLGPKRRTYYLVRNHEQRSNEGGAFGDATAAYDPSGAGGTTTVVVDSEGNVSNGWVSLNGTQYNCAGGRTPWGSWLTCEETINGPDVGNDFSGGSNAVLTQKHGYVFEVPANGVSNRQPIRSAGRFPHEAAAVDPIFGHLYLTEDSFLTASGFYRYKPPRHPRLARGMLDGGRLQMLKVRGVDNADLSVALGIGTKFRTEWVDIDDPDPDYGGVVNDAATPVVGSQGRAKGAAIFSRLEGCDYHLGLIYFTSTQGGPADYNGSGFGQGRGQVFAYNTIRNELTVVYESPGSAVLDLPDNLVVSAKGTVLLCEDGTADNFLRGLTRRGELFDFARNADTTQFGQEFAGATFTPDGRTLFVNIQNSTGYTLAIWGPWNSGPF